MKAAVAQPEDKTVELRKCACGEMPLNLSINEGHHGMGLAVPSCCKAWQVGFDMEGLDWDDPRLMELAQKAWNDAPR